MKISLILILILTLQINLSSQVLVTNQKITLKSELSEGLLVHKIETFLQDSLHCSIHTEHLPIETDWIDVETLKQTKYFLWIFPIEQEIASIKVMFKITTKSSKKLRLKSFVFGSSDDEHFSEIISQAKQYARNMRAKFRKYMRSPSE